MVWDWSVAIVICLTWASSGAATLCDSVGPLAETAYVGAYEIRFPDPTSGYIVPSCCRWLITAYKKDYVIHLQFDEVNLQKSSHDACVEEISVYDGSRTSDNVISRFCGTEQPRLITSSQTALIVLSSNKSSIENGTFRLKYKAIRARHQSGETGQILRIAFGTFVGAIACVVIISWAYRKYKLQQLSLGVLIFGRGHAGRGRGRQDLEANPRTETNRVARDRQASLQRQSFKNKVTGFFQDVAIMFSPRRMTVGSLRTESTDNGNDDQHHQPRQQHTGGANLRTHSSSDNNNHVGVHAPNVSQNPFPAPITNTQADVNDHVTFGYPMIPLNSFTSDPDAVRPPTYEDCIKSVNPLYLHHHGRNTFYNMTFTLKDEESNCPPIFSPPPPYTEISSEIPQAAWGQPHQEPPHYEVTSVSSAVTTPDHETTGYDSSAPEQCCERGESVICLSPTQERPVVLGGGRICATTQPSDNCACESIVVATVVQPIATLELPCNLSTDNYGSRHQTSVDFGGPSLVPEVPTHVSLNNIPVVRAAASAPMELFRRSGVLPSHPTDRLVSSDDNGSRSSVNEATVLQPYDSNQPSHCSHNHTQE